MTERSDAERGAELLSMVLADPSDDEARLVYADWLLGHHDPRGTLIQLQCRLEAMREDDPDRMGLSLRVRKLVAERGEAIAGSVSKCAASYVFSRGLVREVTMNAASFVKHGARILAEHPIESLRLKPIDGPALDLLACAPALGRVRELVLEGPVTGPRAVPLSLAPFARAARLDALRSLVIRRILLDPDDAAETLASVGAPALASIEIDTCRIMPRSITALASRERPLPIERLALSGSAEPTGDEVERFARALGSDPTFARLAEVRLWDFRAVAWPFAPWLEGPNAASLRSLAIGPGFDGDALARAVVAPEAKTDRLRQLDLEETSLGRGGLDALLAVRTADRFVDLRVPVWLRGPVSAAEAEARRTKPSP